MRPLNKAIQKLARTFEHDAAIELLNALGYDTDGAESALSFGFAQARVPYKIRPSITAWITVPEELREFFADKLRYVVLDDGLCNLEDGISLCDLASVLDLLEIDADAEDKAVAEFLKAVSDNCGEVDDYFFQ